MMGPETLEHEYSRVSHQLLDDAVRQMRWNFPEIFTVRHDGVSLLVWSGMLGPVKLSPIIPVTCWTYVERLEVTVEILRRLKWERP